MALPPLALVADMEDRLGASFSSADATRAGRLLDDVSAEVRSVTGQDFLDADGQPAPPGTVAAVVLHAALEFWRNPQGYASETLGSYTYRRFERQSEAGVFAGLYLNAGHLAALRPWIPAGTLGEGSGFAGSLPYAR